jgi:HEAT repeat protein
LGIFGHPGDFDLLIGGLKSPDAKDLFSHAFALYEFEDERAVKELLPLLDKGDDQSRVEISLALLHLLTPESLSAVKDFVAKTPNPQVKAFLSRSVTLREDKLPKDYKLRSRDEQARILALQRNAELTLGANEQLISNKQLLESLRIWKEKGRIYDSGIDWVGEATLIAAAKPENLDQLIDTKAKFYKRLSDECLYETSDMDTVIKYVGRSRYRVGIGVTSWAEPK